MADGGWGQGGAECCTRHARLVERRSGTHCSLREVLAMPRLSNGLHSIAHPALYAVTSLVRRAEAVGEQSDGAKGNSCSWGGGRRGHAARWRAGTSSQFRSEAVNSRYALSRAKSPGMDIYPYDFLKFNTKHFG